MTTAETTPVPVLADYCSHGCYWRCEHKPAPPSEEYELPGGAVKRVERSGRFWAKLDAEADERAYGVAS